MSGIVLADEAAATYNEMRMLHNASAIIFTLNDDQSKVIVEKVFPVDTELEEIVKALPEKDCRFLTYDMKMEEDGCKMAKLCFIQWSPVAAKTRPKMIYSATKRACIDKMPAIQIEIAATNLAEVTKEVLLEKCHRK